MNPGMDMLGELLHLKAWREGKAERVLAERRGAQAASARMADQAAASLADYRDWSARHELELFATIRGRTVRPRDLERLREDVGALRVREGELEDLRLRAARHRDEAETTLGQARDAHRTALKAREKFERLAAASAEEGRIEDERREDVETEDRGTIRREAGEEAEHA